MNSEKLVSFLKEELHLTNADELVLKFSKYFELLLEYNEKFNLTAIKDEDEVIEKHFIDSMYLNKFVSSKKHDSLLDIGSGAGFPALVLAIINPEVSFTLVESNGKKVDFLNVVREELKLNNVTILKGRIEDLSSLRSSFNYATARAVSQLNILVELMVPYLKVKGTMIAYKGSMVDIEVKQASRAIHMLDAKLDHIERFNLPYSHDGRSFVFITKIKENKKKFPRPYGEITSKPL